MALFPKVNLKYLFEILFCMHNFPNRTEQNRTEQAAAWLSPFSLIYIFSIMQIFLFSRFHLFFFDLFKIRLREPLKIAIFRGNFEKTTF